MLHKGKTLVIASAIAGATLLSMSINAAKQHSSEISSSGQYLTIANDIDQLHVTGDNNFIAVSDQSQLSTLRIDGTNNHFIIDNQQLTELQISGQHNTLEVAANTTVAKQNFKHQTLVVTR